MRYIIALFCLILFSGCATKSADDGARDSKYDRAQTAAQDAFKELDCAVGNAECPPAPTEVATANEAQNIEKANPNAVGNKGVARQATKYPIVNGYPVWYTNPFYDGYLGGVGSAKEQKNGGYSAQKRIATALARADLAKTINVVVYTELNSEIVNVDTSVADYYKEKYSIYSRHSSDVVLSSATVLDEWLDESSGELFLWVVLPK